MSENHHGESTISSNLDRKVRTAQTNLFDENCAFLFHVNARLSEEYIPIPNMSVFSLDAKQGNPVTAETVEKLCSQLGVTIEEKEKEDYRRLLAVFHDAGEQLLAMDGECRCCLSDCFSCFRC